MTGEENSGPKQGWWNTTQDANGRPRPMTPSEIAEKKRNATPATAEPLGVEKDLTAAEFIQGLQPIRSALRSALRSWIKDASVFEDSFDRAAMLNDTELVKTLPAGVSDSIRNGVSAGLLSLREFNDVYRAAENGSPPPVTQSEMEIVRTKVQQIVEMITPAIPVEKSLREEKGMDDTKTDAVRPRPSRLAKFSQSVSHARERLETFGNTLEDTSRTNRGPTLRHALEQGRHDRQAQYLKEGGRVMDSNPQFESILRSAGWIDADIQKFSAAVGARKLYLDGLLFKNVDGGMVFKIPETKILEAGLKLIRQHQRGLEREAEGRAKMSAGEREAMHQAVEEGAISEENARDYSAMRAGWFGGVGYTARRRELNEILRPILEPVWEKRHREHVEKGKERVGLVKVERPLTVPAATDTNKKLLLMAIAKNQLSQSDYDTFIGMWARDEKKGVVKDDVEKAAVSAVMSVVA